MLDEQIEFLINEAKPDETAIAKLKNIIGVLSQLEIEDMTETEYSILSIIAPEHFSAFPPDVCRRNSMKIANMEEL